MVPTAKRTERMDGMSRVMVVAHATLDAPRSVAGTGHRPDIIRTFSER